MKRISIATIVLSVMLLSSCKTLYISELTPIHDECEHLLPALKPVFDRESLEYVYGEISTTAKTNSSSRISDFNGDTRMKGESSTTVTTSRDPKIMQTKNYFIDDVNTNICERYGKKAGIIQCRIINGYSKSSSYVGMLGWLFIGTPFLVGLPAYISESAMQIEVNIYDLDDELVASYRSKCYSDKDFVALYYGYRNHMDAENKTNITVFKKAMNDVKDQLKKDFQRVNQHLRKSQTIL